MHGRDGWVLEEYDWNPDTGIASLIYERLHPATKAHEYMRLESPQPATPNHVGWTASDSVNALKGY